MRWSCTTAMGPGAPPVRSTTSAWTRAWPSWPPSRPALERRPTCSPCPRPDRLPSRSPRRGRNLVRRLVFFGTYASATEVFTRPDLSATLIALVRSHWGLGSKLLADLYRPDPTDAAADHMAAVLRDSATPGVAAGYLAAIYAADVTALLPAVSAPALVLHYRGDRVIPHRGGLQLAQRPARCPAGHPRRAPPPARHSRPRPHCQHHHRVPVLTPGGAAGIALTR